MEPTIKGLQVFLEDRNGDTPKQLYLPPEMTGGEIGAAPVIGLRANMQEDVQLSPTKKVVVRLMWLSP